MKCLIVGSAGQLGEAFYEISVEYDVEFQFADKSVVDVTSVESIAAVVDIFKPDIVINCAAYTNVYLAETEVEQSFSVNRDGARNLAKVLEGRGRLIHISTDFVFDGLKSYYNESDSPNPLNQYGRSKYEGELAIMNSNVDYLIVRTSWLYGPHGNNFVEKILTKARAGEPLKVVNDQFGSPTYTIDLAKAVLEMLSLPKGIYHRSNSGRISWFEFACAALEIKNMDVSITPVSSAEFEGIAKRPASSALISEKLPELRNWKEALTDYLSL